MNDETRLDDAKRRVQSLRDQLKTAEADLLRLRAERLPVKVGDLVDIGDARHPSVRAQVTDIRRGRFDATRPRVYYRKLKKNGDLHATEQEWWRDECPPLWAESQAADASGVSS